MTSFTLPGQGRSEEPEWTVWLTVAAALLIGWLLYGSITGRAVTYTGVAGGAITVPATWSRTQEDGAAFAATDLRQGAYGARTSVRQIAAADLIPARSDSNLQTAATTWGLLRSQELEGYRLLRIEPTTVGGREAVLVEYAYLTDAPEGAGAGIMPALMHAYDTIVASGDQYSVLTVAVDQSGEDRLDELNARLQAGWSAP